MKNKEKYDIRYLTFNVSQYQNGIVKSIDIYYDVKRIEKIKFLSETSVTQAMNAIGNWLEEEYVPDILTDKEKAYLSAVIKPFRKDIKYVVKFKRYSDEKEYIYMTIKRDDYCTLPVFEKGKMYKGMELDKRYTLEELGL
jgi:hypothetical protein